jgi:2-dehydro-3-deoxygalactonokinase
MRFAAEREFLSCDWGTSHFRLKWIDSGGVVTEYRDDNGCKRLSQAALANSAKSRAEVFQNQLQLALEQVVTSKLAMPIPLFISGMASSTIGWMELPYARAPIRLDGSNLRAELVSWTHPLFVAETYLISGVATDREVMRGEETEAIGLLHSAGGLPAELTLILPGTHSKHLEISNGLIRDIRTYMTGELYAVLSEHSILASSVEPNGGFDEDGFLAGLDAATERGFAGSVFRTRTRQILEEKSRRENASFLSGLLIGAELEGLIRSGRRDIFLGGAAPLRDLYGKALSHLGVSVSRIFSDKECENAIPRGHQVILARLAR